MWAEKTLEVPAAAANFLAWRNEGIFGAKQSDGQNGSGRKRAYGVVRRRDRDQQCYAKYKEVAVHLEKKVCGCEFDCSLN